MSSQRVRVASAQYAIVPLKDWAGLESKLELWVAKAAQAGASILVFPEYGSMELFAQVDRRSAERRSPDRHLLGPLPLAPRDRRQTSDLLEITDAIQPLIPRYLSLHARLAAEHRVYILAGSAPFRHPDGVLTNRAFLFSPDGTMGWQDKIVLTRWEKEAWQMTSGSEVRVFESEFGPIGIDICYDIEFPIVARRQAEARAKILLAPCCCDSLRGYFRVRVGARARALENQAYVIQSPMIGMTEWLPAFGRCVGKAAIYGPPDLGPHESGIVAQGETDAQGWTYADLDLGAIDRIRGEGVIANQSEWNSHVELSAAVQGEFSAVA